MHGIEKSIRVSANMAITLVYHFLIEREVVINPRSLTVPYPDSFRFHLSIYTFAFGRILLSARQIRVFYPLEICTAERTQRSRFLLLYHIVQH